MKNSKLLWILPAVVLPAAVFWILQDRSSDGAKRTTKKATTHHAIATGSVETPKVAELITRLEEKDRRRLEAQGERLVEGAREALEAGDVMEFRHILNEIIHRYNGDPNPLILEFVDLLNNEDPQLRIWAAQLFMLSNLKTAEAVQSLREIVRSNKPLPYGPEGVELLNEEFPASDFRFRAADTLALYRIEEARDDVWKLYQKTASEELVRPLRRMNDHRMIEKLKGEALKRPLSIDNMKLIGEFRIQEALPVLRKKYEDENLNSDLRFRTLYPLWRITGEGKYFDEFSSSFVGSIPVPYLAVGGEKERDYLVAMLETEVSNTLVKASMALHLRYKYDEPLIGMLTGYFHDLRSSNWKDGTLARRLVGSIDDPELTRVAEEYERKYQTGFHDRYAVYRKNWRYPEWEEALFMD